MKQELMFGIHAVQSLLKTEPDRVISVMLQKGRSDQRITKIMSQLDREEISYEFVNRPQLDKLANGERHQGVIIRCKPGEVRDEKYLEQLLEGLDEAPFLLVLDGVTDPHNIGACLRSADAAGVHAVITTRDKSGGLTSTARKIACGAAETTPFVVVTNLARTLESLQQRGIWIVGTAGEAEQLAYDQSLTGPLAVVMGAEEKGMRRLTREYCDFLVKLPMSGSVSSLNVSVATGVVLFEAVRQRLTR
jgi:23S rRNA (guanosine2251-2'-O)-methyltransferase